MQKIENPHSFLISLFERAVQVADPMRSLAEHLPPRPKGRVVVVGAGKASARMAEAVEATWGPCEGLVITRYGYERPTQKIEIVQAAHPVPDQAGMDATKRMLDFLHDLKEDDFVLSLISGGASALLVAPINDLQLAEKRQINDQLLASGAPIGQMNTVRKHLSSVKGGQLAAAAFPAQMLSLIISDVPGDRPADIGSGPTVGDNSMPQDAIEILENWNIDAPQDLIAQLRTGSGVLAPNDERLSKTTNNVFAAPSQSLQAAAQMAQAQNVEVRILGDALEGEAREIAAQHANLVRDEIAKREQGAKPLLIMSGGELTVTRKGNTTGNGVGGPNAEYALALALELALELEGASGVYAIACDTDGVDGAAEVAGAIIGPDSLQIAAEKGVDAQKALKNNDAHSFFEKIGGQIITGPTLTNVNDFRAILIQ